MWSYIHQYNKTQFCACIFLSVRLFVFTKQKLHSVQALNLTRQIVLPKGECYKEVDDIIMTLQLKMVFKLHFLIKENGYQLNDNQHPTYQLHDFYPFRK